MTDEEKAKQRQEARTRRQESILMAVIQQITKDEANHGDYNSTHELAGVLKEEYDEFWDEVKRNNSAEMVKELVQVAAVAIRGAARFMGIVPMQAHGPSENDRARVAIALLWEGLRVGLPSHFPAQVARRAGLNINRMGEFLADRTKGFTNAELKPLTTAFLESVGTEFPAGQRALLTEWAATLD